ncbi:TPA: hypothetical protein HA244_00625 [Candidatus Micrarchaeota archaeon]|nr:hypothetical protein [Candidatus Micrarchaeota archaeon]
MTVKKIVKGKTLFFCEECSLAYLEKATAEKCQAWCSEHKSCNIEIIANAVDMDEI